MSLELTSNFLHFSIEMAKGSGHKVYGFDEFRLDADKLMLYRSESELPLPPKVVKTLAILVESRGAIISKDELIEAVWGGSIVEESNLSQHLYLLRKTLGKQPDGTPYIETLRRRGYRFTGNCVTTNEETEVAKPAAAVPYAHKPQFAFERQGNVVALVDWKESAPERQKTAPHETAVQPRARISSWTLGLAVAAAGLILALVSGFVLFRSDAASSTEANGEISVLRLTNGIEVVDATISPDGKYFVYHEPDGKLFRMWIQQTGHSSRREIIPASERIPLTKTFTPDGQFVYYLAVDKLGDKGSIYRVAALGGPVTRVLTDVNSGVSFSPDGEQMVFARYRDGVVSYTVKNGDGSGDERIVHSTKSGFGSSSWSPDGKMIAVQWSGDEKALDCKLAMLDIASGTAKELSDERWDACGRMEWDSNGKGIYMIGTRRGEALTTRRDQVFFISYPDGRSRKITSEGDRHQWTSLGVTKQGDVIAVPFNRSSQIWVMDPRGDARSAMQITSGVSDGRSGIGPLADGRVAYISRIGENLNVWVMNPDGSDRRQITENPSTIEELRSGGDGQYLVFAGNLDGVRSHLFRVRADGGELEQITSGEEQQIDSSMSLDGKWITYDSTVVRDGKNEISLWKQSMDGRERISLKRNDCQMPHFSPDDKYISCVREQRDILILSSADGALVHTIRAPTATTIQHSLNFGARWAPDGKAVVYIVNNNGVSNLWSHPIDGGEPTQLTNFTYGSIYHFAYALDGSRLFLARGNQIRDAILIRTE